ncbi:immunity repressor [Mycobacterium phage Mdavu]|uniref:transcriptional repressor n=1 Tax=Mycobacterium phage Enkosi TaxID=1698709 RepID=UPI0006CE3579|nr:transcriptional repressor [Mycobacterium phage Enkosi]ALF01418.1 immunity repressor [Mycobacterium phage Enkosi]QGJ93324.1 immunity repressor [Mycobacterium phage Mdavu]UXE03202.1 immunity repressor [Mycobacterium phage Nikao]
MPHHDDADRLAAYLGYKLARPLKLREILEALQMSKTRYYGQRDEGTLIRPDNLLRAARNLDLNPVDLFAHFNLIADEEVLEYAASVVPTHPRTADQTAQGGHAAATTVTLETATPTRPAKRARRPRKDAILR